MVDIMRSECVQEMKRIDHFCWVNTPCSLNQVRWSRISADPRALDIPDGATASTKWSILMGALSGVGTQTHAGVSCLRDKARNNHQSEPQSPRQSKQLSFV